VAAQFSGGGVKVLGMEDLGASVFNLDDLGEGDEDGDDDTANDGEAEKDLAYTPGFWVGQEWGVENEGDNGGADVGAVVGLERWGAGLALRQNDLGLISLELLLLSSELNGGRTSFGMVETDKGGLRSFLVNAEVTSKGKRTALSNLDVESQRRAKQGKQDATKQPTAREATVTAGAQFQKKAVQNQDIAPFSLQYRVELLKLHRPTTWKPFQWYGYMITFNIWRACQLRLILLLAQMAIKVDSAQEGNDRWKVESESRHYWTSELLQAMTRIGAELASTTAPTPALWETYCEKNYSAALERLESHLAAVRRRYPWIDFYGPLSVHMLECLLATGCFDESSRPMINRDEVVGLLRTVREATDMGQGFEVAALAVSFLRMYMFSRDVDTLVLVQQHLESMKTLPASAFKPSMTRAGSFVPTQSAEGLEWYRTASIAEMHSCLRTILSDSHTYFVNPLEEIPVAIQVYVAVLDLLQATCRGETVTPEEEVCSYLKASVRARVAAIVDAEALEDGSVNVEGCIQAVTNLAEEVEVEALYFAPGYTALVPRAVGVAVLEYIICCKQSVEDSVESFYTLNSEAIRLWRALTALQAVIEKVLPDDCKEESLKALSLLAGLSSLFERCVQSWMDDQASRYAEVLTNCIELEKRQKWAALDNSGVSSSVVDMFHMFHDTVPQLFRLGLPLSRDDILNCISQVDLFVMKYCNEIVTQHYKDRPYRMDPDGLIPKFKEKKDVLDKMAGAMDSLFTESGRQAARGLKEMAKAPKGFEPDSMAENMHKKMSRMSNAFTLDSIAKGFEKGLDKSMDMTLKATDMTVQATIKAGNMTVQGVKVIDKGVNKMARMSMIGEMPAEPDVLQDPVQALPAKDERLIEQKVPELCVRLKNLKWGEHQTKSLEEDVHKLWEKELQRRFGSQAAHAAKEEENQLGEILGSSQMVLIHGQTQIIEYIATKMIFFDLREDFVARLYYPTPSASPLSALLEEGMSLDMALAEASGVLMSCETLEGSQDLLWALLEQVLTTIVKAVEWCIMGEHMGAIERRIVPDDHLLIVEDLVALKRYFVQRDEDGVVNGLDEEKVAAKTGRLEMLANTLLSETTERLIELYYDRSTPEYSDKALIDRTTIVGTLARRPDKAALDLVADVRKQKASKN
jgi:hypothetical protein